ncbi:MAG: hypothetical protein KAJ55_09680 [Anaerolineales bacterium]|nr:hypothetical protein [Anaerolineales bacterium]
MNAKKYKSTGSETLDQEVTPFDLLDRWGRWVGYTIEIRAVSWEEIPEDSRSWSSDPKPFVAFTHNTRDGVNYGATTEAIWGDSQAEVTAKARKRRDGARKRQEKNWGELNAPRRRAS